MITLHHLNKSRSKRVIWLLEELNMPYQLIKHQRDERTHLAPSSLKAIHPLGKAPIIVEGSITLCESGAVMEYIINQDLEHRLRPEFNTPEYYQYIEWLHFAEGSLSLPVISRLMMNMEKRDGKQPMDGYIAKEIDLDFYYIEEILSTRPFFAGTAFSAADIMMTIMLDIANDLGLLTEKTHTLAYLNEVHQREAYQIALSHG